MLIVAVIMISDKSMILIGAGLIMFAAVVMAAPQAPAEAPMPVNIHMQFSKGFH